MAQQELPDDPNDIPEALDYPGFSGSAPDAFAPDVLAHVVPSACRYLGGDYDEGDEICHKRGRWVCQNRRWVNKHEAC